MCTDTCDANAVSHEVGGKIECFCNRGFHGNGTTCTGIILLCILHTSNIIKSKTLELYNF